MELNQFNIRDESHRLILAAIAIITTSPQVHFIRELKDGRQMTPQEVLDGLTEISDQLYPSKGCCG